MVCCDGEDTLGSGETLAGGLQHATLPVDSRAKSAQAVMHHPQRVSGECLGDDSLPAVRGDVPTPALQSGGCHSVLALRLKSAQSRSIALGTPPINLCLQPTKFLRRSHSKKAKRQDGEKSVRPRRAAPFDTAAQG
jgi:hypothetical protein